MKNISSLSLNKKLIVRITAGVLVLVIVILGGLKWYDATHFRLVGTEPKNTKSASIYTQVIFRFNKPIDKAAGQNLTITPKVEGSTEVKGKELIFTPKSTFANNTDYTANLSSVHTADGTKQHGPINIKFKISFEAPLSKERETELVKQQVDIIEEKYVPVENVDELKSVGVGSWQIEAVTKTLLKFQPQAKQIEVDTTSVRTFVPTDKTKPIMTHFSVLFDGKKYSVKMERPGLTSVHLYISDGNKLVLDSGVVDVSKEKGN